MNAEQIRNMEAGRELDALVAERVMGRKWYTMVTPGGERSMMHEPGHVLIYLTEKYGLVPGRTEIGFVDMSSIPAYSTDIGAAWEVVERLLEMGHYFSLHPNCFYQPPVWGVHLDVLGVVRANTLPLAVCRAALAIWRAELLALMEAKS